MWVTHNRRGVNSGATQQQVPAVNIQSAWLVHYDHSKLFELKQAPIYLPKPQPRVLTGVHLCSNFSMFSALSRMLTSR